MVQRGGNQVRYGPDGKYAGLDFMALSEMSRQLGYAEEPLAWLWSFLEAGMQRAANGVEFFDQEPDERIP